MELKTTNEFYVKLISITQPLIKMEDKSPTPEDFLVYLARVSNPSGQEKLETAPKLLNYLIKNQHWSPFEMVDFTVEIETSRAVARQILRHWSFAFQEFSQRYAKVQDNITYKARRQDNKNRQNSVDDLPKDIQAWFEDAQEQVWTLSNSLYEEALEKGIAKEQARFMLPENAKTKMYLKGDIRRCIFYLKLRSSNGTQKEHSDIANAIINEIFVKFFPNISKALGWLTTDANAVTVNSEVPTTLKDL